MALDGTGYFSSQTIHCASCLHKVPRNGSSTYYHHMLGAAIIHPDRRAVIPLMPAPIVKQDGTAKNDGERKAATRFLVKLRQAHPHLTFMVTEDSLSANAPHLETLHAQGLHDILGVKEGEHGSLFQQVQVAEHRGYGTSYERQDRDAGLVHRVRCVTDVPRNESHAEVRVHCIESWDIGADSVQHLSWVTDLRVSQRNVSHLMRGGRARWKMENETLNTLNNHGYHCEHNDGHGMYHLSVVFAVVMMLAFLVDQTPQLCCALCQAVWTKMGRKRLLWERLRALFSDYDLDAMRALFEALFDGLEKPHPILTMDTSETPWVSLTCLLHTSMSSYRQGLCLPQ